MSTANLFFLSSEHRIFNLFSLVTIRYGPCLSVHIPDLNSTITIPGHVDIIRLIQSSQIYLTNYVLSQYGAFYLLLVFF